MTRAECTQRRLVDTHFAGRIGASEEREMRAHLETCESCRQHYQQHLLLAELDPRTANAKERLRRGLGLETPRPSAWRLPLGFGVAATAAVLAMVVLQAIPTEPDHGFAARGTSTDPISPHIVVYDVGANGEPTEVARELRGDAKLAIAYDNPTDARWLMVFATSADGQVFWYYPAWTNAADDPIAIAIEPGYRELPEAVTHDLPAGEIVLHALFLDAPMSVEEVEASLGDLATLNKRAVHHATRTFAVSSR